MFSSIQRPTATITSLALAAAFMSTAVPAIGTQPEPAPGGSYDHVGQPLGSDSTIRSIGFASSEQLFVGGVGVAAVNPRSLDIETLEGPADVGFIGSVAASGTITRTYLSDTDATVLQLDPTAAWDFPSNPRPMLSLSSDNQSSIDTIVNASTRVAVGSNGASGSSGRLSIVDVRPGLERVIFSMAPIDGHDVSALQFTRDAKNRAMLLGGTSASTGDAGLFAFQLGSTPTAENLRIVQQPWAGVSAVEDIVELDDGRVWALLADGSIHELRLGDSLAGELSYEKVLEVPAAHGSASSAGQLERLSDGKLVGSVAGTVFTVDVETRSATAITAGDRVAATPAQDGMFFFSRGADLYRYVPGAPSSDTSLAQVLVDGVAVALPEDTQSLVVDLPPSDGVPHVSAVPHDYRAEAVVSQANSRSGVATIVVTAASGDSMTYTVQFRPMPATDPDSCSIVPPAKLDVTNYGVARSELRLNSIATGKWADGRPVVYVQGGTPGDSAVLGAVDPMTQELLFSTRIPEITQSLSPVTGPDGKIYVPGFPGDYAGTNLVRFNPQTQEMENLGQAVESETHITRMQVVGDTIWMGTFPNAHIVSFDTTTDTYTDHGRIAEDEWYARAIAHDGQDTIYAGTEGRTRIVEWNLRTGEKRDLPMPENLKDGDFRTSLMAYQGGLLFAYFTASMDWHVWDPTEEEWIATLEKNAPSMPTQIHPDTGRMYFPNNTTNRLFYFDFQTRTFGDEGWNQTINYYIGGGGLDLIDLEHPDWPGTTVVGMGRKGGLWLYNPSTKQGALYSDAELPMSSTTIRTLHVGPDGMTYLGYGLNGGALSRFNPTSDEIETQTPFSGSQVHRIYTASDGTMYMGTYTDAQLVRYDPSKPYLWGENPRNVARFGDQMQDRLFALAEVDSGKIAIGGWGKRGNHHGLLATYDPTTDEVNRYTDILPGHQKLSMISMGNHVIGGTSVATPGATPIEPSAKIYAWDPESGKLLWETVPIEGVQSIHALFPREDGKIWATTGGNLTFLFDPETRSVVQEIPIGGEGLSEGVDGYLYSSTGGGVMWRMDPNSGDFKRFDQRGYYPVQGPDGSLYWTDQTQLFRGRLIHEREDGAPKLALTTSPAEAATKWVNEPVSVSHELEDASASCVLLSLDAGDTWAVSTGEHEVSFEGVTNLLVKGVDVWGNQSDVQELVIRIDVTQPEAEARFVGKRNGHVTITGHDALSGVDSIEYRIGQGEWQTYEAPIVVDRKPRLTIDYRAIDRAGNVSEIRTIDLRPGRPVHPANQDISEN